MDTFVVYLTLERYENQCRFAPGCLLPARIAALCSRAKHQEWGTDYWPTFSVCRCPTRSGSHNKSRRQFKKTIQNHGHAFNASFLLAWRLNHYQECKCRRMVVNFGHGRKAGGFCATPAGCSIRSNSLCSSRVQEVRFIHAAKGTNMKTRSNPSFNPTAGKRGLPVPSALRATAAG